MLRSTVLTLLLLLLLGLIYLVNSKQAITPEITRTINSKCLLSVSSCDVKVTEEHTLKIDLLSKSLPVMEPILLSIANVNEPLRFNKAWFEGQNMNMGKHFLLPSNNKIQDSKSLLVLKGMIPVCHIDSEMVWHIVLEFSYQDELIHIYFEQEASAE